MFIYRTTKNDRRYKVFLGLRFIEVTVEKPAVGGGWYTKEKIDVPLPWAKMD